MRTFITLLIALLLSSHLSQAQGKIISVIGSSTAAGSGASTDDSSWVNRLKNYYQAQGVLSNVFNLALSGTTTYDGMPTGFVPPPNRPSPDPTRNVTRALSFNPDVVLVCYPSNDLVLGYTMQEFMSNLRTIYNTVVAAGKICYITSSQPRDALPLAGRQQLKTANDSILAAFPIFSVDFWTPLADPVTLGINPLYSIPGDGIHVNDAGHRVLFEAVKAKNILAGNPLPLKLMDFFAGLSGQTVLVRWTTTDETGSARFIIQRSGDGSTFEDAGQVEATGRGQETDYSWTDQTPLPGKSYYRLKILEDGSTYYSRIAAILSNGQGLDIVKLYTPDGQSGLIMEVSMKKPQQLTISVINATGVKVRKLSATGISPSSTISVSLSGMAAGQYFVQVATADGKTAVRGFIKF
ncbi:MAG TPA: GDSL-type esterase/lipase family protein [Puia sp.]|nr:GDSL-type esterase/lipase family protein [Puia sp.]